MSCSHPKKAWSKDEQRLECVRCGRALPFGKARDGLLVLVEIRAAQLATEDGADASFDERYGWERHRLNADVIGNREHQSLDMRGWVADKWAGWLAREIVRTR